MLKPERVTFSADDDKFHQFANSDQLDSFLNDSLVHYSTDFKKTNQQEPILIKHSNSLDELSSIKMSSQQQQQQTEHEPPTSAPPSLLSEQVPILNENNLHQFDALTLQQLAIGSNQTLSSINEEDTKTSPSHSVSHADIQKEIDRVKQMKYGRTYSSPTSSLCSRITTNPFNGSNNNIDLSAITHSVHFNEQSNQTNRLPFSSTYITSIPESIVPASGSSSTNDNHFIPIHYIESPSLEDREVFETFHTKQTSVPGIAIRQPINSLNRDISKSETDLIASLHRSASKQALDNQSDHGTTYSGTSDDVLFVEWDKERSLFQDYINSLRTEIRILLQERADYQKQMETINNNLSEHKRFNITQTNTDQTKLDLLQKSLEEKNLVIEQLQKEYEIMKEKNSNLTRKISNLRCDGKAQTGVIDELKQKIAELTVDIQNHILIKRRLEISMMNLENDCKIIDAERLRLNNDIKDKQLTKQDLEKLLQQANVQIAEQGSTIEMLRSDNIQIRSQLSATQRRMLQEKQQVMDYLRQIENDLVEKEQLKQRESILRKDFEKLQLIHKQDRQEIDHLNLQINQDQQKLNQLEQERLQLLKTIQNMDDKQIQVESELDSYKSATKRLYTHFKIPFDSIQSIDQLIPMVEDRYRTEQISHARVHDIPLVQSAPEMNNEQETEEIRRLRDELVSMNIQLKQLDEANQAWQQYQQNQLVLLRDRLKLTDVDNLSFEDIVQQIENHFNDLNNQLVELQDIKKTDVDVNMKLMSDNIRQSKDTQTEDNEEDKSQEIPIQTVDRDVSQYEEELRQLRHDLAAITTQCAQLDEANRAWQQYHQTQLDSFKDNLKNSLPMENSLSLDDIAQHILGYLNHVQNEHENLMQKLQTSEKFNNDLRSESTNDNQTIQQTYVNTINELNQQLSLLKQQNDQLETEKYMLNQQLDNQSSISFNRERSTPTPDSISFDSKLVKKHIHPASIHEAQIHNVSPVQSASPLINEHEQELQQLRETVTALTNQCAQFDQVNRAWQQFQQTQLENFRSTIHDYFSIDENLSLEQTAQQIVNQITKEREDFTQQYYALEKVTDDLRSESETDLETMKQSYVNTINELNQQLLVMKEKSEQTNNLTSPDLLRQTFEEIPIASNESVDQEEIRQLRENLVSLTAQLDETNQAWQQYQQTQLDTLQKQLENCLLIDYNGSFGEIVQQIVDQVTKEREDFSEKYEALERANNDLRSESNDNMESIRQSYMNTVNELNQELLAMKEAYEQLDREKQGLIDELEKRPVEVDEEKAKQVTEKVSPNRLQQSFKEVPIHTSGANIEKDVEELQQLRENVAVLTTQCAQLDAANRAWLQFQQTQLDNFQTKLHDYFPIDENTSFDEIAQQIADQVTKEREDFSQRFEALERAKNDLRSESSNNLESIRQSYMNTVNELNQELLTMKEAYEQLDSEKQVLIGELEKRPFKVDEEPIKQTIEKVSPNPLQQLFKEVPIHTSGASVEQNVEELQQLRENVVALTAQCAQLDAANRAWQQFQQTQLDNFQTKLHDYIPIGENTPLDQIAQQIVDQILNEREDFNQRFEALERANNHIRSESNDNMESIRQSNKNIVEELNQKLLAMKEAYEQVDAEKQVLIGELEKRTVEINKEPIRQTVEKVPSDLFKQPFEEVPIHTSGTNFEQHAEELRELRENVTLLTNQCAQLEGANRAWQQFQQTQSDNFRTKLGDYVPIDDNTPFDQIAQQIIDQIVNERQDFNERYEALEKANNDLRSESTNNLESIKESYTNTINELDQELLAMKEAYEQLDAEKQVRLSELEKRPVEIDEEAAKQVIENASPTLLQQQFEEVPIHISAANVEEDVQELQQLRESVAVLTNQCAQLDEANRAWQLYQQTQLDNFRSKFLSCLPIDENLTLDQAAQHIVDEITKEREDFRESYAELQKINNDLISESATDLETFKQSYVNTIDQLSNELLSMKERCEKLNAEKQILNSQLEKQSIDLAQEQDKQIKESSPINFLGEVPLQTSPSNVEQENEELEQLREKLTILTSQYAQLNEANRAWQEFHQSQLDNFRTKMQDYIQIDDDFSFDKIAQQILDEITKQQEDFTEQYLALEKTNNDLQSESIETNKNLLIMKEQYEQLLHEKEILVNQLDNYERDTQTIDQLRENVVFLTTQLDETKHLWQQFDVLKNLVPFSNKISLNEIIQDIILYINNLTKEIDRFQQNEQLLNQQILSLQNECQTFKQQFNELEKQSSYQENTKQTRRTPIQEVQIHRITPVQSAPPPNIEGDEEIQQLRTNLSNLTAQCAQLDEANRAWQQFHENQLGIFRNKLQDWILLDENSTLEQIAQQIVIQLDQLANNNQLDSSSTIESLNNQLVNYQLNESVLAQNLEQLNQKLLDVYQECEEFREHNAQLILSKQKIEQQLEERQQIINDLQLSNSNSEQLFHLQQHNYSLTTENQQLQFKLNDTELRLSQLAVQRVDSPRENVLIHNIDREEEIRQLRIDLAAASAHCLQLDEANRAWQKYQHDQIESFRQKLQEQIPTFNQIENTSLDFIIQQIINYLDQLNIQRDNLIQQNNLLKDEIRLQQQQQSERPGSADSAKRMFRRHSQDKHIREAQIHNVSPVQSASPLINEHEQELQQLRENLTALTNQCAQLDQVNRAWQQFQQTQLENFRNTIHDYLPVDENLSLEQTAQQIVNQITKEREDFTQQYYALEKVTDDLRSESETDLETMKQSYVNTINELNQQLLVMKEKSEQTNNLTSPDLLRQTFEEVPIASNESVDQEEIRQLRENLVSLTAQLDETNQAWQQYQQTQLDTLQKQLENCLLIDYNGSFGEIVQQIVDQVTKEREDFSEKYEALERANNDLRSESNDNMESIRQSYMNTVNELNQELLAMKEAYERLDSEKRPVEIGEEPIRQNIEKALPNRLQQSFKEVPIHNIGASVEQDVEELQQLRENVAVLTTQCAQLDAANHAWQQFQQTQLDNFQTKLHDYFPIDGNTSFDEIAQQIADQVTREREDFNEKYQELLAMKEAYEQLDNEKRPVEVNEAPVRQTIEKASPNLLQQQFKEVPIHTSGIDIEQDVEELQQLRENVIALTAQCAQLDAANHAWQQYQQTQLDNFKAKLHDYLPVDENTSFDEIAEQIVDQVTKEREDFSERYAELEKTNDDLRSESASNMQSVEKSSPDNVDELNQELLNLKTQYAELEMINKQLLTEKEVLNNQLNDRSIVVGHHSASESNLIEDETPIELKQEPQLSSPSIPTETEEILQIRSDLALITSQFTELAQTNENELNSFRNKLQNWISLSLDSTLDEIAQQLTNQFEQQQQNLPQTIENQTQTTQPSEKVHIAVETIPLTYENHQTQIDPIDMIDQQIQTESFQQLWSTSDDENLFNSDEDDDRLKEYIDEITSLSSLDLSNRLNRECQQILSKQNIVKFSHPNLELNHLVLITIYSLYNQHLTDDAKQLYNETLIRALKQEYELINSEKNDYMEKYSNIIDQIERKLAKVQNQYDDLLEQNELENLDSKQSLNDLIEKYEFNLYNLHQENENLKYNFNNLQENYQKIQDHNYEQLENEYQQLRRDYNEIINQNELLKDYNSQMYQLKLQNNDSNEINLSHDIDIQCNLSGENQLSSWNNDWEEGNTNQDLPIQEQGSEKLSNEEEINRLKIIISEIQIENQHLKEFNLQNANNITHQSILVDNYVQTEFENEQTSSNQTTVPETEDNDWNIQMSPLEIPSDEPNVSSITKQTVDNETQTDEQSHDKLTQVNNKLKRVLQTIKDKIHQAVIEQPQLFTDIGDETIERLDHLISTIENQAIQIDILQNERDHAQHEMIQLQSSLEAYQYQIDNERGTKTEQLVSAAPVSDDISQSTIEDYEKQIKQLQQKLSQNEDERSLLRERLNELEMEFTKTIDDRASTLAMYEDQLQSAVQERNALVEQQVLQSAESQQQIEQLQEELTRLKQSDENIKALHEIIEQQSQQLKDLNEKYIAVSSQPESQVELDQQKKETEERLIDYENQIEHLTRERTNLLEELQKNASSSIQTTDNDKQPDDKLVKNNNKLKRALQSLKDKIHRVVTERPELFVNIGEETSERLDHLISTVEHQATQMDILQAERNEAEEQLRNEIQELQSSVEAYRYQIENERPIKTEALVSAASSSEDISPSTIVEDYEKQIKQLQQKLSQNEDERSLLRERLNEVELEFTRTIDDRASTLAMYEDQLQSTVQERNALVQQQVLQSAETQREIEQLHEELAQLKQTSVTSHVDIPSNEDVESLQEVIKRQSEELEDLGEKYFALLSQIQAQDELDKQKKETDERLINYENQIQHLIREHENLLEQVQKNTSSSPVQTIDDESQTDDQQHDKIIQINNKLKRALQSLKDKIHRVVTERPELFANIGEETSERLDHLISTVEHQATQIDILQTEHDQSEEQLRNEIQELQSSLEACQHELTNQQPVQTEQLLFAAPLSEDISDYEKQIKQLQQKLSQNEDERSLLRERLNEVELDFTKTIDDRASTLAMYEDQLQSAVQERNALVEQHVLQSTEYQRDIEQLQQELDELKQASINQPVDVSSNEEIQSLKDIIEQRSEELKDLNEKHRVLSTQFDANINLQAEFDRQRKETEERLIDYENQIENLTRERTNLLEELQKNASSSIQTTDNDKQPDDKLVKINNKLKRALQSLKDKIHRVVTERPELFVNIGEETSERLDHLISTVEHQATQMDILQAERNEAEEQLRDEIQELQSSVEAYRYQIENERPIKTEALVSAASSSDDISDYQKQIKQLQQKLSQNEDERSLLRERLNEVELEFTRTIDDRASTLAMYEDQLKSAVQERNALVEQQVLQSAESEHRIQQLQGEIIRLIQSEEDIKSLHQIIEQQSQQLKDLYEKYIAVSSQPESQAELDQQKKETEERLIDYENQIENLTRERTDLLEELQKNASSSIQTTDNDKQPDDKLVKINNKLKRALQSLKDKIHRVVTERPELFVNIGEETSERLDHLISTVEHQATQMDILQAERNEAEEQLRNEINELQNSFDLYRQQVDNENRLKQMSSAPVMVHKLESEITEHKQEIHPSQASNDNQWNDWSTDSSQITDKKTQHSRDHQESTVANRLFGFFKNVASPWSDETSTNDWNDQSSPLQFSSEERQQTISSPTLIIENQNQEYEKQIERLTRERDEAKQEKENYIASLTEYQSQLDVLLRERISLMEQINQLDHQSLKQDIEIQTDNESLTTFEQRISRRVFEQEMLAWSKESEQLKQYVKQIQIENKKLKDIILKFERIIHDYMHENDRLKQENQQFSLLSYSLNTENLTSSDTDICYLTLKWLTYEVALRTSDNNEQSLLITDDNEPYLKQRLIDTERQLKTIRVQNQRLKKQLETYTIQFKHIQHEMNIKIQELSTLKIEIDRLRTSETQYRLEVDRLKADFQCDQVKFQQLERELTDLKLERTNLDNNSTNNLQELLELKERELNALKDKLDYTIQAHQLELQEAIKANQFSLDNVQRFEQLDQRHQEKRKVLEARLGKICKIIRPLIDNQYLFNEDLIINIDELQQLITDTEAEEKVINSLGPIRDCLGLLESQMKELHDNLIENHARRSKRSKYRLGFESSSHENQWEITPDSQDLQRMYQNPGLFIESMSEYSYPITTDFIENDVRLCLDNILDEVIVRTTVK